MAEMSNCGPEVPGFNSLLGDFWARAQAGGNSSFVLVSARLIKPDNLDWCIFRTSVQCLIKWFYYEILPELSLKCLPFAWLFLQFWYLICQKNFFLADQISKLYKSQEKWHIFQTSLNFDLFVVIELGQAGGSFTELIFQVIDRFPGSLYEILK